MYLKLKQINALITCMFIGYFLNATFCIHEPGRLLELHCVANDCTAQEASVRRKSNLRKIYVPVRRGTAVGFRGSSHKVLWSSSYMAFCFSEGSS